MIYDLFCFFNELDVLEERLIYLYDHVDKFVLCESNMTHTGIEKPYIFEDNINRFSNFKEKIIYLKFHGNKNESSWVDENLQRNFIMDQIEFNQSDKIIISDVDEIPSQYFINRLKNYNGDKILISIQELSFFWPNYRRTDLPFWAGGSRGFNFAKYSKLKYLSKDYGPTFLKELNSQNTLTKIRLTNIGIPINKGGWHLSYMGGIKSIEKKIQSFAHVEFEKKIGTDIKSYINRFLKEEKNFFGDNEVYLLKGSFLSKKIQNKKNSNHISYIKISIRWYALKVILITNIKFKLYGRKLLLWSK